MFKSSGISRYSIRWRQIIHKPLVAIFKLTLKRKVRLLRNDAKPNGKPVIYAATHVFYDDIAAVISSLDKSAHLLFGVEGPNNTPKLIERIALAMNGIIVVKRNDKKKPK